MWGIKLATKRKSLKAGIVKKFCILCGITILLSVSLSIVVFFNIFQKQIFTDLKTYAVLLEGPDYMNRLLDIKKQLEEANQRVTIINPHGKVLFDSNVAPQALDNHSDRPEVKKAGDAGEGTAIRHSNTLGKSTYYYAVLLPDGNILRIALESDNVFIFFIGMIPFILLTALLLFMLCIFMSHFLSKKILQPIEDMATDITNVEGKAVYEELIPFSNIIKEQHENIKQQVVALEKSSRIRQDFTANVSHELKTPITIILGYAELMETGMAAPSDVIHFSSEIRTSANRLLMLINDIIELSELDSREAEFEKEYFALYELAKRCVEKLSMKAEKHRVKITVVDKNKDITVSANKGMIEDVIINLLDNAIRYNKVGGSVVVTVEENGFTVEDTGIGIAKEHLERVFERFYRVDKSRSKATGGTGLGLAIVKHMAEKNGASVTLASTKGVGTKVSIIFKT